MNKRVKIKIKDLEIFVINVLKKCGLDEEDAKITCDVLLLADKRGIESHGVARLKRYVNDIKQGTIRINNNIKIIKETPVSIVVDGEGGMGQPIAYKTMKQCIEKAKKHLICFATIRNSNHYGIAGYYTLMALKEDMIGIYLQKMQ
jgi:LDH2 family malate/lactate/ureidoglycolate dehydrogenase